MEGVSSGTTNHHWRRRSVFFLLFLLVIFLVFSHRFFILIKTGTAGVQVHFQKVMDEELSAGFHLKNPFVRIMPLTIQTEQYVMKSSSTTVCDAHQEEAMFALTKDNILVMLEGVVLFHLIEDRASDMYRDIGGEYGKLVVYPESRSAVQEIIGRYDVEEISQNRQEIAEAVLVRLRERLSWRGIEVEAVLLDTIRLP